MGYKIDDTQAQEECGLTYFRNYRWSWESDCAMELSVPKQLGIFDKMSSKAGEHTANVAHKEQVGKF